MGRSGSLIKDFKRPLAGQVVLLLEVKVSKCKLLLDPGACQSPTFSHAAWSSMHAGTPLALKQLAFTYVVCWSKWQNKNLR